MSSLLIKNVRIIDPTQNMDKKGDILVQEGLVHQIGSGIEKEEIPIFDGKNLWAVPGLIDMHVHFRDPGGEHKESIESGSRAALAGGFTSVCCMPNTQPALDNEGSIAYVKTRAKEVNLIHIYPIGAATRGRQGLEMTEVYQLKKAGAVALSDDGSPISDANLFRRILEYAHTFNMKVIEHCEDVDLFQHGVMNEGYRSSVLGLKGIPSASESVMVSRNILISQYTGVPIHLAHVSKKESVEMIRWAKANNISVSAETAPHYFSLTEDDVKNYSSNFKMNPPLGSKEDVEAVLEGLRDGTIDVIATDHAPHQKWEKNVEFDEAPFGIIGLETAVSVGLHYLVHKKILSPMEWVNKMSCSAAKILDLPGGSLKAGMMADMTLIDPEKVVKVNADKFYSKSRNTPYHGHQLKGKVVATIVGGKVLMKDGKILKD